MKGTVVLPFDMWWALARPSNMKVYIANFTLLVLLLLLLLIKNYEKLQINYYPIFHFTKTVLKTVDYNCLVSTICDLQSQKLGELKNMVTC